MFICLHALAPKKQNKNRHDQESAVKKGISLLEVANPEIGKLLLWKIRLADGV